MSRPREKSLSQKGKRMILLGCFAALIAVLGIWIYHGNRTIGVTKISVVSGGLPAAFDGFTIAQISDLHNARFGENQKELLSRLEAAGPDMIAVTGDLVDSRHTDVDAAVEAIVRAAEIAPVYYVTGNHEARIPEEYRVLERRMKEAGVQVLRDEAAFLEKDGQTIEVIGLDDPNFTMLNRTREEEAAALLQRLESLAAKDHYTVLLSHRPQFFEQYCEAGVNLVLTGHAHGGQIRLPFAGGVLAPDQGFFPRYTEGSFESGETAMIVSRGLGNSLFPFRVNNPPELVVATLRKGD